MLTARPGLYPSRSAAATPPSAGRGSRHRRAARGRSRSSGRPRAAPGSAWSFPPAPATREGAVRRRASLPAPRSVCDGAATRGRPRAGSGPEREVEGSRSARRRGHGPCHRARGGLPRRPGPRRRGDGPKAQDAAAGVRTGRHRATSSEKAGLAPVVFEHWLHRAKYTCRLCHVDVGFAMKAGGHRHPRRRQREAACTAAPATTTGPSPRGERVFAACRPPGAPRSRGRCARCHSWGGTRSAATTSRRSRRACPAALRQRHRLGGGGGGAAHQARGLPGGRLDPAAAAPRAEGLRALPEAPGDAGHHLLAREAHGLERLRAVPPRDLRRREAGGDEVLDGRDLRGKVLRRMPRHRRLPALDCQRCHSKPVQ